LWALLALLLAIVRRAEGQTVSSNGWRPLRWPSIVWGLALAGALIVVVAPAASWAVEQLGLTTFAAGLAELGVLPPWLLVVAAFTGGIVEEALYRGYAVERLAVLTGSDRAAAACVIVAFAAAHVPFWGWGAALTLLATGGVLTVFYVWRRDLLANIIAHVVVDLVGLAIVPFAH